MDGKLNPKAGQDLEKKTAKFESSSQKTAACRNRGDWPGGVDVKEKRAEVPPY